LSSKLLLLTINDLDAKPFPVVISTALQLARHSAAAVASCRRQQQTLSELDQGNRKKSGE
jgi:hypothetical protein